jgi:hypothetical protein
MSREDNPEFMQCLEEVVCGITFSKEWEKVIKHKVGMVLETLSHGQQSAVTALQQLYSEIQQNCKLSYD